MKSILTFLSIFSDWIKSPKCHPERSEESLFSKEILRLRLRMTKGAQNDIYKVFYITLLLIILPNDA